MSRFMHRLILFLILLILVVCGLFFGFRARFSDAIRNLAKTQVTNSTSDLINDAIDGQIEVGNIQYDRIVFFEKDLNGRITALKTNMSEVNRLKTDILNLINDEILAMDTSDLGVPFGSFIRSWCAFRKLYFAGIAGGERPDYTCSDYGNTQLRCIIYKFIYRSRNQPDTSKNDDDRLRRCNDPCVRKNRKFYCFQPGGCSRNGYCWAGPGYFFTKRRKSWKQKREWMN